MRYSQRVHALTGEGAGAWAVHSRARADEAAGRDVVVMSVGDPDVATPAGIVEVAVEALRSGDTHYAEIVGRPALRRAVADEVARRGGPPVGPDQVVITAGAQNALFAAAQCLLGPGDEVVCPEPRYVTYDATVGAAGATLVAVPSDPDAGLRPDLDALAAAVGPRTRALLVNDPNNPSGVVLTAEEAAGLAELARAHDLWVLVDEVYATLAFDRRPVALDALPGMAERTATVGSLSKSQAMTGWRVGWLVGPPELARHAALLAQCMLYGLPGFTQEAARAALVEHRHAMDELRDLLRRRRDRAVAALRDVPGLSTLVPEAGMFLLLDVRATGLGSVEFARRLYDEQGVAVLAGAPFGAGVAGHVRVSFALDDAGLDEGCRRIRAFAESLAAADPTDG